MSERCDDTACDAECTDDEPCSCQFHDEPGTPTPHVSGEHPDCVYTKAFDAFHKYHCPPDCECRADHAKARVAWKDAIAVLRTERDNALERATQLGHDRDNLVRNREAAHHEANALVAVIEELGADIRRMRPIYEAAQRILDGTDRGELLALLRKQRET